MRIVQQNFRKINKEFLITNHCNGSKMTLFHNKDLEKLYPSILVKKIPHGIPDIMGPLNPFMPTVPTFAVRETASLGIMGAERR